MTPRDPSDPEEIKKLELIRQQYMVDRQKQHLQETG